MATRRQEWEEEEQDRCSLLEALGSFRRGTFQKRKVSRNGYFLEIEIQSACMTKEGRSVRNILRSSPCCHHVDTTMNIYSLGSMPTFFLSSHTFFCFLKMTRKETRQEGHIFLGCCCHLLDVDASLQRRRWIIFMMSQFFDAQVWKLKRGTIKKRKLSRNGKSRRSIKLAMLEKFFKVVMLM